MPWLSFALAAEPSLTAKVCAGADCAAWPPPSPAASPSHLDVRFQVDGPAYLYVVGLTRRQACDVAWPAPAARASAPVSGQGQLTLRAHEDLDWQPDWASVHVFLFAIPMAPELVGLPCELARTGRTLDELVGPARSTPTDSWAAVLGRYLADRVAPIDVRGGSGSTAAARTLSPMPPYAAAATTGELARARLGP